MRKLQWEDYAWDDYLEWQTRGRKALAKVNSLIKEIQRTPFEGSGKPEPLRNEMSGWWSRRIDQKNRIVYYEQDDVIHIVSCLGHYED